MSQLAAEPWRKLLVVLRSAHREAGALPPLVQLLSIGSQMAGGDRRLCCVALGALRQLAPASKDALGQVRGDWARAGLIAQNKEALQCS